RVPATGVEVRELSCDDALSFHLLDTAGTHAGVDRIVLGPPQGLGHRLMMNCRHFRGRALVGQRPQNADTFDRREGEIEPGDGLADLVPFAVYPGDDVLAGGVFIAE